MFDSELNAIVLLWTCGAAYYMYVFTELGARWTYFIHKLINTCHVTRSSRQLFCYTTARRDTVVGHLCNSVCLFVTILTMFVTIATLRKSGYNYSRETSIIHWNDPRIMLSNSPGGSTMQCGGGEVAVRIAYIFKRPNWLIWFLAHITQERFDASLLDITVYKLSEYVTSARTAAA